MADGNDAELKGAGLGRGRGAVDGGDTDAVGCKSAGAGQQGQVAADLHNNKDSRENAGKADPRQDGQLAERADAGQQAGADGGDERPDNGAAPALGEDLEALREADEAGAGAEPFCQTGIGKKEREREGGTYTQVNRNSTEQASRAMGPPMTMLASTMLCTPGKVMRKR